MASIKSIIAREILDSRGIPTVEVDLTLSDKSFGRASVPSGASTGSHEAVELRDGDSKRFHGKGVQKAVKNVNTIILKALAGKSFEQRTLDAKLLELDGTPNKGKLGANAILGVSLAFAKATAESKKVPLYKYFRNISKSKQPLRLPMPMMNFLNGGKHADQSADIQEFMIVPHGAKTFSEAIRYGSEVFQTMKKILKDRNLSTSVGDEGGFAPTLPSNESALELIVESIIKAGYKPGKDISIAMDVAATELYSNGQYVLARDNKNPKATELISLYESWVAKYPIISIEDPLSEDDWNGWKEMTDRLGKKIQIVGDDLFVTNIERLQMGIEKGIANSILIKLNQIGTVSETIDAITMAEKAKYTQIISHRSGETEDSTIADFVVGIGSGQIKTGSMSRSERIAKYNQLIRIEEELGKKAIYAGTQFV